MSLTVKRSTQSERTERKRPHDWRGEQVTASLMMIFGENSRTSLEFHSSMAEQGESSSSACEATERQACAEKKVTLCA